MRGFGERTGAVALALLVVLATLLGVACLCSPGHAGQSEPVTIASAAHHGPDRPGHERACLSPGHDHCGTKLAVDTPTTGPGPHPQPLGLPARVDSRPAPVAPATTWYTAAPRAPDLHVLQVLRT